MFHDLSDKPSTTASDIEQSSAPLAEQARAAEESVLVVAQPDRAAIVVSGKDRTSWLNGLVTCDLAKLGATDGAYGLLVEKKGRIQTDLFLAPSSSGPEGLALAVPAQLRDGILATLDHYLIMEDAELTTPVLAFYVVHGPKSLELVQRAREDASLGAYAGAVDLLGKGGAVLAVAEEQQATFERWLGVEAARLGGLVADAASWEAIRIAHGLPRFGVEFDPTLYPQEASLEKRAVSFSKGCYLGQEVVYMLENRGHVKRKLVTLDIDDGEIPANGAPVSTADGTVVGDVKSAVRSPIAGMPVAIAMVKWAQSKAGTELRVDGRAARVRE